MSLLDLIFEQKIIVISVLAALIPLCTALVLLTIRGIRRMLRRRAERRIARENAAAEAIALQRAEAEQAATAASSVQAAAVTKPEMRPHKPEAQPAKEETPSAPPDGEQQSDEMQSLLASVFGDVEEDGRFEALLRGAEPVNIDDLVELSQTVAGQLRARGMERGA